MFEIGVVTCIQGLVALLAITGSIAMAWHVNMQLPRKGEASMRWSWIPFLGWAIEMGIRPIELLQESADKFGEIFGLVIVGNRMFFINDAHSAHILFRTNKDLTWQEFQYTVLQDFFGSSKTTLSKHLLDEDLMRKWFHTYIFSDEKLNVLTARMIKRINYDFERVSVKQVKMYDFISRLVFNGSIATVLNHSAADDPKLYDAFIAFDKLLPICVAGIDLKHFPAAFKARKVLDEAIAKYTDDNCELFQMRWQNFKESNIPLEDAVSFQLSVFWASIGNTMPTSFWLFYYLMLQPALMAQAKAEVREAMTDGPNELTSEQLGKMVFVDACITETLRLTSGSLLMRYVKRPCEITLNSGKTYKFRKGDRLGMCPALIHNDNEVYPNAGEFIPSRWLVGATAEERLAGSLGKIPMFKGGKEIPSGSSFLPFGYGATYCPGRRFARNEMKTLVVLLLSRYDFSFVHTDASTGLPRDPPVFDKGRAGVGIFPPKNDILVNISLCK